MDPKIADQATSILDAVKTGSPYFLTILGIVVITVVVLRHIRSMAALKRDADPADIRGPVTAMQAKLDTHIATSDKQVELLASTLQALSTNSTQQLKLMESMNSQLILLNASSPDAVLDLENARLLVRYQWAWAVDVAIRATTTSIENNNFHGNEALVVEKIWRAWFRASREARKSLDQLNRFRYPYAQLFNNGVVVAFEHAVRRAIPLFHREYDVPMAQAIEAFTEDVKAQSELILEAHYRTVEDIDHGSLYGTDEDRAGSHMTSQVAAIGRSEPLMSKLAQDMRMYRKGTGGHKMVQDRTEEIKSVRKRLRDGAESGDVEVR